MTMRLARQEAVDDFASYLRWKLRDREDDTNDVDSDDEDSDEGEDFSVDGWSSVLGDLRSLNYTVSKAPAFPDTPVAELIQDFGAVGFVPCLPAFLQ